MKNFLINSILLVVGFVLFNSCSKNDSTPTDNPVGGDAYRMQIVTIDLPNTNLDSNEYNGSIGNVAVTLIKSEDHKIVFTIPSTVGLGNQTLVISDLNNMKVTYNIKDYVLTDTADATIAPFQNNMNTFQATSFGNTATQNAITSFNQIYANASAEDKIKMAKIYKVNQTLFDLVTLSDFSNITGKNTQSLSSNSNTFILGLKFAAAMIVTIASATLVADPATVIIGIPVFFIAFTKSVTFLSQIFYELDVAGGVQANGIDGQGNKNINSNTSGSISITNNVPTTVTFNIKYRTIISSDSNKTETTTALFFKNFNILNDIVSTVNPVIEWVNTNVPFANFNLLSPQTVPNTSPTVIKPLDAATFEKLTFSITDPALSLQNVSLTGDGQLSLHVAIIGSTTVPYQSTLHYSYADDLNSFTGTLPITLTNDIIIGSQQWMSRNLDVVYYRNGDPIPQVTDPTQWANLTTGAWCYYNNDPTNGQIYGKLYNWYAVNDPRGLAPEGYHIPNNLEWNNIINVLGGNELAGGKMRALGTNYWLAPNSGASNSSRFTALPCGNRGNWQDFIYEDNFYGLGTYAIWWSSSQYFYGFGNDSNPNVISDPVLEYQKVIGIAVRCLKD